MVFETLLRLAEMEIRSGEPTIGRTHLSSLEKEAAARGFGLIARKARAAREANGRPD